MRTFTLSIPAILFLFFCSPFIFSQELMVERNWPFTLDEVKAICADDDANRIYLGGNFNWANNTGKMSSLLFTMDKIDLTPNYDYPSDFSSLGPYNAIASDQNGGWFMGGFASSYGSLGPQLIFHLDHTGKVSNWSPDIFGSSIQRMKKIENQLFIWGNFQQVYGQNRTGFAVIDLDNDTISNIISSVNGLVSEVIQVDNDIIVVGNFSSINGVPRDNFASIDLATGNVNAWSITSNSTIRDVSYEATSNRFVAVGEFTEFGGLPRQYFASFLKNDTIPETASLTFPPQQSVFSLSAVAIHDNKVYLGGGFDTINNIPISNFVKYDLDSDSVAPMPFTLNAPVNQIIVDDGVLYFFGNFNEANGQNVGRLGMINLKTDTHTFLTFQQTSGVFGFDVFKGLMGFSGIFNFVSRYEHVAHFAIIDQEKKEVLDIDLEIDGPVHAITFHDGIIYIGGNFTEARGNAHINLLAYDPELDSILPWFPEPNNIVHALHVLNDKLYVGGDFNEIDQVTRTNIAGFNLPSRTITSWSPSMNSTVNSIRSNNNTLILAGCFSIFENNNRPGLALVDAVSGNLSPLNPMGNNVGICVKDALIHNGNLFVTGIFNGVFANQNRRSFAAFDYPSGNLQPIHVNSYNSSMGHSLSVYKNELIIGGMFSRSTRTSGVVRIDLNTGNEIPQTIINNTVYALESFQDKIAMGGLFFIIDGQPWRNFAVFSEYFVWEGTIDSNWNISGNWTTNAIPTPNSNIMLSMEALNDLHLDQNRTIGILNFNSSDVKVDLGNYNLTANEANLSGKRTFVRTSGSGLFKQATDPGEKKIFPVGTEYYAPVVLKNRSSIPNTFSIRAIDSVYGIPNDQIQSEHVKLSWEIQAEHSMENHPADLQFKWTFTNETSNFSNGKLHHFYGGFWREIYPIGQHAGFRLQQNNYLGRGEYFALVGEEGGTLHHEKYNLDQNHVSLFPNPSNGNFAIRIYSEKNQSSKISILSTDGKLHHKDSIRLKEGENEMLFSGKPLSPGMYLVVIETAEGVITKRIIVL